MKVSQFIEMLQQFDPDLEVLVASDPEGNGYETVHAVELEQKAGEGRDIWLVHPDDYKNGDADEPWSPNCVVVWP